MKTAAHGIVVGVDLDHARQDLTEGARRALDQALLFAEALSAGVVLAHVAPGGAEAAAEDLLNRVAQRSDTGRVPLRHFLGTGPIPETLAELAEREGSDLVILGRSEAHDSARMGGVAARILELAVDFRACIVRPRPSDSPARILAGVDFEYPSQEILLEAAWLARLFHAELHVAHAWQTPIGSGWVDANAGEGQRRRQAAAEARLEDALHTAGVTAHASHVGCDHPARALRHLVEALRPTMLVMGTHSRRGIPGLVLGNTAERVLTRVESSLWVIPGAEAAATLRPISN